jgi:transposase
MATRAEWSERVRKWERSGLEIADFARREGLNPKLLGWWRWKLQPGGLTSTAPAPEPRFLPVHVVATAPPRATAPIEIALPNGRVVRILPGFDPATLERVLAIVGADEPSC